MNETAPKTVTRECPFDGCDWSIQVEKTHPQDEMARDDAEHSAEMHFEREHKGKARVKVVLEREVSVHPKQDLGEIVDSNHDRVDEHATPGFEVAYAAGEFIEEPDETDNADGPEGSVDE